MIHFCVTSSFVTNRPFAAVWRCALCLLMLLLLPGVLQASTPDERFLNGLLDRRLFGLAQRYCREELARDDLSEFRQAELVSHLARALAEEARGQPLEQAEDTWQQALDVTERFLAEYPEHAYRPLVLARAGIVQRARAELLVVRAEVARRPDELLQQAQALLRDCLKRLQDAEQALTQADAQHWNETQRYALQTHLLHERSQAYRIRGRSYPPDSADRSDALNQAQDALQDLARRSTDEPYTWTARLDLVEVLRLQHRRDEAQRLLTAYRQDETLPPSGAVRLRTLAVRLALDAGDVDSARRAAAGPSVSGPEAADLALANLEIELAEWAQQAQASGQAPNRQRIAARVRLIEREFGPYWGRRAKALETRTVSEAGVGADTTVLAELAAEAFHNDQFDQAIEHYVKAHALALEAGEPSEALDWAFRAAAIEHRMGRSQTAAERFLHAARSTPEVARAAEAHAWAIYHTGLLTRDPESGVTLDDYQKLLEEHLETWPSGPTLGVARVRLGRLYESRGEWTTAAEHYARVPAHDPRVAEAVESLSRVSGQHLARLRQADREQAAAWAKSTAARMQALAGFHPQSPSPPRSAAARKALLEAVRLLNDAVLADYAQAVALLDAIQPAESSEEAAGTEFTAWRAAIARERVLALVGTGRVDDALAALEAASAGDVQAMIGLLAELLGLADRTGPRLQAQLARLQLEAVERVRPRLAQLDDREKALLDYAYVRSRAVLAPTEAVADYQALIAQYPRERRFAEEAAQHFLAVGGRQALTEAERLWRRLGRTTPGSESWLRARLGLAETLVKQGQPDEAVKLIDLTRVLAPDLGGGPWPRQFETLRRRALEAQRGR